MYVLLHAFQSCSVHLIGVCVGLILPLGLMFVTLFGQEKAEFLI